MYKSQVRLVPDIFHDFCSIPKSKYILRSSGDFSIPLKIIKNNPILDLISCSSTLECLLKDKFIKSQSF